MKSNSRILAFASIAASVILALGAFVAVWLLASGSSRAASAQTQEQDRAAQITVRGSGSVQARPDTLVINIGVTQQEQTVNTAQSKVSEVMGQMEEKLKAAGVAEQDYRTTVYNVEPVMDFSAAEKGQPSPGTLVGFRVTNMLEVTLRDPARAPELIDALTSAGANTIYGINYTLADAETLAKQAYDEAVKDAEERAERLATLSGQKLGRIVSISEASAAVPGPVYGEKGAAGGGGFAPGQQTVQVDVIVTYEAAE